MIIEDEQQLLQQILIRQSMSMHLHRNGGSTALSQRMLARCKLLSGQEKHC
jgi:hypothetical protein